MDPQQLLRSLQWLEKLSVFNEMWRRASGPSGELTREQVEERVIAQLKEIKKEQEEGRA